MSGERPTTPEEARRVGDQIGVDWDHFSLFPDYYERLDRMEQEAKRDWAAKR